MPNFKTSLEKATSQLLLEPDWDSVLQIVDSIRQGDVQPKAALFAIKKKIGHENPHVAMFALQVLEACVKNCGSPLHVEVASKEFMEFLKDQVKSRADPVKEKILELVQTWSHAFRNEASYKVVEDTFHLLKMEGYKFPALKEADAMFDSERAPSWKDGETCTRCRVQFGVVQRKHHCRNCGEVFCAKCSTKTSIIPKLGFEREVRVCDSCFDKINKMGAGGKKEDDLPAEYLASPLSKQPQAGSSTALPAHRLSLEDSRKSGHSQVLKGMPPSKNDQEQQEEEELMLALALSKSEHESKEKERERLRVNYGMNQKVSTERAPSPVKPSVLAGPLDTSDMDPELARYLNRHYWQQKVDESKSQQPPPVSSTVPSAPAVSGEPRNVSSQQGPPTASPVLYQNGDTEDSQEQFLSALRGSLEIFINRMRSNSQRGRPIANDSAVQSLFAVISDMHPQLMSHIQEKEDARSYYEGLQDKLTQLRDAREALDSLREEHREKRRREAEEMERQRQIQMMQKLEIMRQKKHEYLEMQRQLALQRLQEQEREMAARFEQQKQLTHIRQMQAFGYQQGYPQNMAPMHGVLPGGGAIPPIAYNQAGNSVDGSPVHRMANDNYGMMQQGLGHMGPPHSTYGNQGQPGLYNLAQQPLAGQYSMGHIAVGGFQADGQGMVGPQGYLMNETGPVSLPVQHSGPHAGGYNGLPVQMSSTGLPYAHPHGTTMDNQQGYPGSAAQVQEHQSFNMQGVAHALPSQPNSVSYNSQVAQHQPANQPNSVGFNSQVAQHQPANQPNSVSYNSQVVQHQPVHQPNSGGYNSQANQHQAPYQPQPMGQFQPGADIPTSQQEAPLISFD